MHHNRSSLCGIPTVNGRKFVFTEKNGKVSMMESFKMLMKDVEFVQEVQINSGASHNETLNELSTKSFNIEKCRNKLDFTTLIKMDFPQEAYIKRRLFGRRFENMACPSLTKCYMRCITIGQTFNDTFSFIELEKSYIQCTSFKDGHVRRLINKCVKPCALTMMRHVMMAFIQSEVLTECDIGDYDFHDFVANNVFFHDRLIERWMCEIDADVVFHEFSTKASPGDSLESKKFKKVNVFVLFDCMNQLSTNVKTVYVLDGDYLRPSFKKQLYETRGDTFSLRCNDVIQNHEIKVSSQRSGFNAVDCLHDFKKLSFISTVGGFVSNREIERMSTRKACRDVIHPLFSFFMALFCQVFSRFKLNQQFVPMVEFVDDKRVEYDSRFSVCGDGHVLQTIKYETANNGSGDLSTSIDVLHDGQSLESVYKSPTMDIDVQIGSETNGYYLGCKDPYREHLFGKDIHAHRWQQNRFEDRGIKHLYECHHACTGDESCDFCNETIRSFGLENFFVENEEMCCHTSNPNYDSLRAMNNERLAIDERNKKVIHLR